MVSTNNGERGRVKGLKNKNPYRLRSRILPGIGRSCLLSAFGYGAVKESGGQNRTLSSSVRLTRTAAKKQRPHKETKTGRWSKLAEVKSGRVKRGAEDRKVKKDKKWETRPRGGNLKIKFCLTVMTETKDDWCKEQKRYEKTESRMLISQHYGAVRWRLGWAKPSQGKTKQE